MTYEEWKAAPVAVEYWSVEDADTTFSTLDEAVEATAHTNAVSVRVIGWRTRSAVGLLDGSVLERALEALDDEFAREGEWTEPTQKMKDAEAAFIAALLAEYEINSCEECVEVDVPIAAWVRDREAKR